MKTEEAAEKYAEVAKSIAVRENFDAGLTEFLRGGAYAVKTVRVELRTTIEVHVATSENLRQTTAQLFGMK